MGCDDDETVYASLTVNDGQFDSEIVCLPMGLDGRIVVEVSGGTWASELSWVITTPFGDELSGSSSGRWSDACIYPAPSSSPAPSVECETYVLDMSDSYGDGWQGNYLSIISCEDGSSLIERLTLYSGSFESEEICLPVGGLYNVTVDVDGGIWKSEVSWILTYPDGVTTISGGAGATNVGPACDECEEYEVLMLDYW